MRVSGSQLKLMAALSGLVVLVVATSGVLAERGLRQREMARIARSLEERALLVRALSEGTAFTPAHAEQLDAIAATAAEAAGARVTLIAPDGAVVGDSDVPLERLPMVESHASRPEVRQALAGRVGRSERRSETVGRPLLYLAVPAGGAGGVVRVAMDLSELDAAAADLRRELLASGALGLVAALALSYGLAWLTLRPIREIRRLTAAVADGDLDYRLPRRFGDELGEIAGAIQRLAEQLRQRLAETTAEKERLQAVLDGMAEGVLVVDRESRVVLANDRLREFFGIRNHLVGRTPLEGVRHAELAEALATAAASDAPVAREIRVAGAGRRTLRVHAVRFPAPPETPVGTVAVLHDVTDITRLDAMRRDFVANASHELRTPLAAVRGFAETLLDSPDLPEAKRRSSLEVIDRHARRLGHLVDDLLQLSTVESGKLDLQPDRVDTVAMLEALLRDAAPRLSEKRLHASCTVDGSPLAWADGRALDQILGNLLDNAIQYTEPGGSIQVSIGGDDQRLRIEVQDTGIGIPEADQARIFERFYRVDKARSRELGGTGLGLSIVKHLVQGLGGEISVASTPGRGSTFSFDLPRPADENA
jgi:two-component system phosphate regulon sensor histidine kinase PhoR